MPNSKRWGEDDARGQERGCSPRGRQHATSHAELEHVAFDLFDEHGFERTTVDDIAAAAGIGRRTFFRYFPSKNDVVWGELDQGLADMRERFRTYPTQTPLMMVVREVVVEFNRVDPTEVPWLRRRMTLILTVPALRAHSTLRYADWRRVVAESVGHRLQQPGDTLMPQAIAHAALGVAVAAYGQWLREPTTELTSLLDTAMRELATGFAEPHY